MGGSADRTAGGPDGLNAASADADWNRFSGWSSRDARLALFAFLAILIASAFVPVQTNEQGVATRNLSQVLTEEQAPERERDEDLALYDRAIERIQHGENYYDFIVEEHRRTQYPVRPGVAVRLPTLAYIDAWLGLPGQIAAAFALMTAVLLAWWKRLGEEAPGSRKRLLAFAFLMIGATLGMTRHFFVLHELWAGMLLALSFGLHRPGRWGWSLAVAALAVAIREHALPFVMLMAAMAFWRRDWKEGAAWTALTVAFLVALAVHLSIVSELVLPSERPSDPWLVMRGLSGWLSNIALSSNLRFLPHWLAGPAVILMVLGWCGWRSPAGTFGTFLFLGYGLAFMLAGRPDNFYWGAVIAPAMFMGLAFVPRFSRSLVNAALAK